MNLKWKRGLPTEPSLYWYRRHYTTKAGERVDKGVLEVRYYVDELAIGNSRLKGWRAMEEAEWAGPISEPEE